jgi:predicted AAA+ superfamily ATPase
MPQIYKFFQFPPYLSVAKATEIKSSETVQDYIRYLEEAYMVGVPLLSLHNCSYNISSILFA